MAASVAFTNPIGGQAALRMPGAIFVTVSTGGATYATPTGVAIDFATILAAASSFGIAVADIVGIMGVSNDGYNCLFTFSSGTTWNLRMWTSGASEIGDGAVTKTVKAIIWLAGGSLK